MEKVYEKKYHEAEENHWWFLGRREAIVSLMERFPREARILEVGCAGGILLRTLQEKGYSQVFGVDISKEAIELCRRRGVNHVSVMDGESLAFDKKFDIIILSDVLEHIKNEKEVIHGLQRSLISGGKVICFVPAFMFLWSYHDEVNQHFRRYTRKSLIQVFRSDGFKIIRASYWNTLLFFPIFLGKKLFMRKSFLKEKPPLYSPNKAINTILSSLLRIENALLKIMNFPFGVSVFLVGEKE